MGSADALKADLARLVGRTNVLVERSDVAPFEEDWTGRFHGRAEAVVIPPDRDALAGVLRWASTQGVPLVPQGGNTGLVGGAVPLDARIVVSTEAMAAVEVRDDIVEAGAGATLGTVQNALHPREVAVDLAARDSASIGGMIATDAGGMHSFRFGRMRRQLIACEALAHDGTPLAAEVAMALAPGNEGTLCFVTRAILRTRRLPTKRAAALIALTSLHEATDVADHLARTTPDIDVVELIDGHSLELAIERVGLPRPFDTTSPAYLFTAIGNDADAATDLVRVLAATDGIVDSAMGETSTQTAELWRYRDLLNEALKLAGPPLKLDVAIPPKAVARLHALVTAIAQEASATAHIFGHILDGNMHVNLLGVAGTDSAMVEERVLTAAVEVGGHVVGEHGAGHAKREWLRLERDGAGIERFHELKQKMDPNGILNPGVIAPVQASL